MRNFIWVYIQKNNGRLWLIRRPHRKAANPVNCAISYDSAGRMLPMHGFSYRALASAFEYVGKL